MQYIIFKLFTQLRTGHNHLNAQRKWGYDKICINENCDKNETLMHFLFECKENRIKRNELLIKIQQIYENEINLTNLNNENKLKHYLFPFHNTISDKNKMKNKSIKEKIYEKRTNIMNIIYEFCKVSGRFDELFNFKFDIKTW